MLSSTELEAIEEFDTCTIANAIEYFRVRPRNEGFTRPGLRCVTEGKRHLLGYAFTSRVRFSNPSVMGLPHLERTDWWSAVDRLPLPRVAVIQDMDSEAGSGAAAGVHGVISIPLDIAAEIPQVAARRRLKDRRIVRICLSSDFSKLLNAIRGDQE